MAVLKNSPSSYKRFQYSGGKQKQKPEKKKNTECTIRVGHDHTKVTHSNPWLNAGTTPQRPRAVGQETHVFYFATAHTTLN